MFMKFFQLKPFYFHHKSTILKTILSFTILLFCLFKLSAQKESNIKLKIEAGLLWDWVEGKSYLSGPFIYLEPKLKTSKNTIIGLRIGAAETTQRILSSDPTKFYIDNFFDNDNSNSIFSFVPTFDYYFNLNNFRPYLGFGIGYYFLTTTKDVFAIASSSELLEVSVNNKVGFLLRGGFNLHKVKAGKLDLFMCAGE